MEEKTEENVPTSSKRRREDEDAEPAHKIAKISNSEVVAKHYNSIEEKGLAERFKSKIFHMRNFNNWVKSMLISDFIWKIRRNKDRDYRINVLDMCCGKGGDLLKWQKANISHLICTDIADVSVEQCKERYQKTKSRNNRIFSAEFYTCDATNDEQKQKYENPEIQIDLTSCQFAFHYCFESLPQAEQMIQNAADCLKPGGYFIGTIPDSNEIMKRYKKAENKKFGNEIYHIELEFDTEQSVPPLFGAKYNFHLEEVVDCPEFLVHFPTFVKLAEKYKLKLVLKETFEDFYYRMIPNGKDLVEKMQVFETYSADNTRNLSYDEPNEYEHAKKFIENLDDRRYGRNKVGTLAKSEWEAISLYLVFAFEKVE